MSAIRFANLGFQGRLTLVAATAVAVPIIVAAVVIYVVVKTVVYGQVDASLRQRVASVQFHTVQTVVPRRDAPGGLALGPMEVQVRDPSPDQPNAYLQLFNTDGQKAAQAGQSVDLPVTPRDLQVASGDAGAYFRDDTVNGVPVRVYTVPVGDGVALEVARSTTEVHATLGLLQIFLAGVVAGGIALAAILGRLVAHAALRPVYRLRAAVDHVTDTHDMTQRVPDERPDELGRLGAHFNRMLGALDQSLRTQRQLVADASHELRTPLASLRTNVEVLQRSPDIAEPERGRLLRDVVAQVEQLTRLIQDLIDLARGDQTPEETDEVRLDWVVASAVDRAAVNWPEVRFETELAETVVEGQANRLERAISNLLDNAGKWSPPGGTVEVRARDREVTVRDHGPGIDEADLPYVFDRFWRAPAARAMPGSGLGLAIVHQVADAHHAKVTAELPEGGGTLMRLSFPEHPGTNGHGAPDSKAALRPV